MNYYKKLVGKLLWLITCSIFILSCNQSWERVIEQLIGQTVIFPKEMLGFETGKMIAMDMNRFVKENHGVVLSVFTEVECKTCMVEKVPDRVLRIKEIVGDVPVVLVFPTQIGKEIETISKLSPGIYCMIDKDDEFKMGNRYIPKEEILRTWFVDDAFQIRVCGDPSGNEKIEALYMQVLLEKE